MNLFIKLNNSYQDISCRFSYGAVHKTKLMLFRDVLKVVIGISILFWERVKNTHVKTN